MSDDKENINPDEFGIAHVGNKNNPDALLVNIPITEPASRGQRGMDESYGRMRRLEAIVVMLIKSRMAEEKRSGVIKPSVIGPDGKPMPVA